MDYQVPSHIHSHCSSCHNGFCSEMDIDGCTVISCQLGCGSRLHQCKLDDHKFWCPLEKVACINRENGCPVYISRWKLGIHLESCPASVIRCTSEWNRWPLYSQDIKAKAAIPLDNPHIRCSQLDVSLAMRDQRMLIKSLKAPVNTRRVLRNAFTKRYPAVPIAFRSSSVESDVANSADTSRTVSDDDSDAPWESSTCPPGLQRSVCSQLYQASQVLPTVINTVSHNITEESHSEVDYKTTSKTSTIQSPRDVYKPVCNERRDIEWDGVCEGPGASSDTKQYGDYSQQIEDKARSLLYLTQPMKLNEMLGVDFNIELITRFQAKPSSMYTFLCAQEFRRDEYPWHYKNVHNDIHCLLNGWLEQRCPLAYAGCNFSFQRFVPTESGSVIIHSSIQESFAVRPPFDKSWASYLKKGDIIHNTDTGNISDCDHSDKAPSCLKKGGIIHNTDTGNCDHSDKASSCLKKGGIIHNTDTGNCDHSDKASSCLKKGGIIHNTDIGNISDCDHSDKASSCLKKGGIIHNTDTGNISDCDHSDKASSCLKKGGIIHNTDTGNCDHSDKASSCLKKGGIIHNTDIGNISDCDHSDKATRKIREATPEISTSHKFDSEVEIRPFFVTPEITENDTQDLLTTLPYEILHRIASCLDAFSLSNLSLTCKCLRDLCCNMLEERGIVIQVWEKRKLAHRNTWQVTHKRWFFSSSFSPVEKWVFQRYNPIAEHLKVCPFNQKITYDQDDRIKLLIV